MSRDTTTGAQFEEKVTLKNRHPNGIDLSKGKLYKYLKSKNINWQNILSRKLLPDEAYFDGDTLYIYEKKYQQVEGSADEKLQTCGFKIYEFKKIAKLLGAKKVKYTYILSDWFKQSKYKDVLVYINDTPGCWYEFEN